MVKSFNRFLQFIVVAVLLLNAAAFGISEKHPVKKEIKYSELSKILGDAVIICSGDNPKGYYLTSFERLEKEQHQKLKKQIDLASYILKSSDSKYINDIYSVHVASIHSGAIKNFATIYKPEANQLSLKFSTAPPVIS